MLEKGFTQVVNFSTTEQQTVLDLVYTTCPLQVETIKIPTFYSYHEAVLINLEKKFDSDDNKQHLTCKC